MRWISLFTILLFLSLGGLLQAQKKAAPLTLAQVLTGLQTQGTIPTTRTLVARNQFIALRVRERGVTFQLLAEYEKELRNAGASDELIKAIRENSPTPPKPKPTLTPKIITEPSRSVLPQPYIENLNGVSLEMILVPAGKFTMGSDTNDDESQRTKSACQAFTWGRSKLHSSSGEL